MVSGPATLTGITVTLTGNTGTVTIRASQGGNAQYNPAPTVDQSFQVTSCSGNSLINRSGWSIRYADSEELQGEDGKASNAIDGNTATIWHTQWQAANPVHPHEIQIDLGATYNVSGFRYLPRQDATFNGTIANYECYVSTDGSNWGTAVAGGTLAATKTEKEITFPVKSGRYLRLRALSEVNGNPWTSAAEINVLQGCTSVAKQDQTINFPAIADKLATDAPFALNATASSGLPVSYAVISGPATVSGSTVTLTGSAGTVTIRASQSGDTQYNPAPSVDRSFAVTAPPTGNGTGLTGNYFNNMDFTAAALQRVDPVIDFNWGTGSPDPSMGVETFSVRWEGDIQANYSEVYTFYITTDDGMRLWVNNQLIIDRFIDQAPTTHSATIALTAGQNAPIRLDYYENGGGAVARLEWSSARQVR